MNRENIYKIYGNLLIYLDRRGKTVPAKLSKKDCIGELNSDNMIVIRSDNVVIALTKYGSKYSTLLAESKKRIKELCDSDGITELLYICDVSYTGLKTNTSLNLIHKIIQEIKQEFKKVWLQIRSYQTFQYIIPDCIDVPEHRIVPLEDAEEMLKKEYKKKSSILQIYEWDNPVVWLGARSGDFVEVDRYTPSVGMQKILRYVNS